MSHRGIPISLILRGFVRSGQKTQGRRNSRNKERFSPIADLWTFTSHRRITIALNALSALYKRKTQEKRLHNEDPRQHPEQENLAPEWTGFAQCNRASIKTGATIDSMIARTTTCAIRFSNSFNRLKISF